MILLQERPLASRHLAHAQISQYRRRGQSGGGAGKAGISYKIDFLRLVALLIPCALITVIGRRLIQISRLHLAPSPEAALTAGMRTPVL
jgi:hypothetical protein